MSKVKILFFAADPLSAPPDGRIPRLLLDEDVRRIREKVRAAEHRDALEFDVRWAARTDDLLQALNETRPQVVHFSGHGGNEGLVLVGSDGRGAHRVDASALAQLFRVFKGDIRVAVLNACFSLSQAEAIAGAVGCAIGTRGEISDRAAITFGASFYRAVAFGHSVKAAYDQARTALALEHFEDRECPQLVVHPGVDPARLILVPPGSVDVPRRGWRRAGTVVAGLALAGTAVAASLRLGDRTKDPSGPQAADSTLAEAPGAPADTVTARDTTPAATTPRRRTDARSGDGDRHPIVVTPPSDAGKQSVEAMPSAVDPATVHKQQEEPDPFAVPDTPRTRTLRPAYPH